MTAEPGREPQEGAPPRGADAPQGTGSAPPPRRPRRCPTKVAAAETMASRRSRLLGELDALLERLNEVDPAMADLGDPPMADLGDPPIGATIPSRPEVQAGTLP